jgi:hypothetical protein
VPPLWVRRGRTPASTDPGRPPPSPAAGSSEHTDDDVQPGRCASRPGPRGRGRTAVPRRTPTSAQILPAGHPDIARTLDGLGLHLRRDGRAAEAEPLWREAYSIRLKTLPKGHWITAQAESRLGDCLAALGRYEEAEPLLVGSYETLTTAEGVPPREPRAALEYLVQMYEAWGKPEQAAAWSAKRAPLPKSEAAEPGRLEKG